MLIDLNSLLASLPMAVEDRHAGIQLCGWLAPSEAGEMRIVAGDLCLCFREPDVLEIERDVMTESGLQPESAIRVRVLIRRGAPLLDLCLSKVYEGLFPGRKPFALAVRPHTIRTSVSGASESRLSPAEKQPGAAD
ncbi:MAG TPA: hypothetical protein VJP87_13605 [Candidatus Acidoferrales bacterium]|nr:hypothetical protein [Candidatus Acidoferrales bacterium]